MITDQNAVDAELAVLGSAMAMPGDCQEAFERLRPEHFYDPVFAKCWCVIQGRWSTGVHTDYVTLHALMENDLRVFGGLPWLARLVDGATLWALESHIALILDTSAKRAVSALLTATEHQLATEPAEAVLAALERGAADIARTDASAVLAAPVGLTALENIEAAIAGEFRGTEVGLACLDHVTGGIKQDDVWFFGARTSMGKSVVCLSLGRGIAEQGRGVLMFSLEMPVREVQARMVADIAHNPDFNRQVRYGDILNGRLHMDERERARDGARKLASLPFMVTDAGGLTIDDIRRQALRQVRGWEKAGIKPGAILIDHIGLVVPVRKTDSKAADTTDTVNELKSIAKALRCPIIALAQVNRGPEGRQDKRPTMGDLNWSGAIEQIADFVCLLYRESYYLARSGSPEDLDRSFALEHELELLIHKNRSGPICTKKAWVDVACNAVRDRPEDMRGFG
jgi:replicative DNA helicase